MKSPERIARCKEKVINNTFPLSLMLLLVAFFLTFDVGAHVHRQVARRNPSATLVRSCMPPGNSTKLAAALPPPGPPRWPAPKKWGVRNPGSWDSFLSSRRLTQVHLAESEPTRRYHLRAGQGTNVPLPYVPHASG